MGDVDAVFKHPIGDVARPRVRLHIARPRRGDLAGGIVRCGGLCVGVAWLGRVSQRQFHCGVVGLIGEALGQCGAGGEVLAVWRVGQRWYVACPAVLWLGRIVVPRHALWIGLVVDFVVVVGIHQFFATERADSVSHSAACHRADRAAEAAEFRTDRPQAESAHRAAGEVLDLRSCAGHVALPLQIGAVYCRGRSFVDDGGGGQNACAAHQVGGDGTTLDLGSKRERVVDVSSSHRIVEQLAVGYQVLLLATGFGDQAV
jgi:hypothetical protein